MLRKHLITASILLSLMVLGAWSGWWLFLATYTQRLVSAANAEDAQPRLTYSSVERYGFPFKIGLRFTDMEITGDWGDGEAKLVAANATLSVRPWRARRMTLNAPGGIGWATTKGSPAAVQHGQALRASGLAGPKIAEAAGGVWAIAIRLEDISHTIADKGLAPLKAKHGRFVWKNVSVGAPKRSVLDIAFSEMTFPQGALFGESAQRAEASLRLTGAFPFSGKQDAIKAWRAEKGRVDILSSRVIWGGLDVSATGAIGLDAAYRPSGGVDIRLAHGDQIVDRLAASGQMNATAASLAKAALAFAALGAKDGRAAAPLTLTDGEAAMAGFVLGPLAPVCACQ